MNLEDDYKIEGPRGSGTHTGYSVEARYNYSEPKKIGDQIFDNRWKRVQFDRSVIGVPAGGIHQKKIIEQGLLSYPAAQALRWWMHAVAEAESSSNLCFESRIISHKLKYSFSVVAQKVHEHIHGEDRSNCIPDWGVKGE